MQRIGGNRRDLARADSDVPHLVDAARWVHDPPVGDDDVEILRQGQGRESGGAINSPQLLQLSGVGGPNLLRPLGIDVVADLPGVGENLQDHLEVYVQYACKQPVSVAPALKWRNRPIVGAKWLFLRSGPGATNHFEGGGFARSNDDVAYPNLMFHFLPIAIRYDGSAPP